MTPATALERGLSAAGRVARVALAVYAAFRGQTALSLRPRQLGRRASNDRRVPAVSR